MSDDKYSHLGIALVAVMIALGTFAAGFYNGAGVSEASQTAAVINATAVNGAAAAVSFRPEEIRALRELLAKFNANRPIEAGRDATVVKPQPATQATTQPAKDDCEDLYQASIGQSNAANACYDKWEKKCNPLQNPPRPGTRPGRACEALIQACDRMSKLASDLRGAYDRCIDGPDQTS